MKKKKNSIWNGTVINNCVMKLKNKRIEKKIW